ASPHFSDSASRKKNTASDHRKDLRSYQFRINTCLHQDRYRSFAKCSIRSKRNESCQLIHPTDSKAFYLFAWRNFFRKNTPMTTPTVKQLEFCDTSTTFWYKKN